MRIGAVPLGGLSALAMTAFAACQKEPPPPDAVPLAEKTPPAASIPMEAAVERAPGSLLANPVPPGVVVLDADKLRRFRLYEERLTVISSELMKESASVVVLADGGRPARSTAVAESAALARKQVGQTAEAMAASGLTAAEIQDIGRMVTEVLRRRTLAQIPDREAVLERSEEALAHLPPDQRAQLQGIARQARADKVALRTLSHERIHFGDSNVDLILEHESELKSAQSGGASSPPGMPPH